MNHKNTLINQNREWVRALRNQRLENKISQQELADMANISRPYLNSIEGMKNPVNEKVKENLLSALEKLACLKNQEEHKEPPLSIIIDYVRIRFKTTDVRYVIEEIMHMSMRYFGHADYGFYGYKEHYWHGDIVVMFSPNEKLGVLLELKGEGCKSFGSILLAQKREWCDFFRQCLDETIGKGVMKRLDLAVNDTIDILNVSKMIEKCEKRECITVFRNFKYYSTGALAKRKEERTMEMGKTLYIGSRKSLIYFCIYQKDYEQYIKHGIPLEENRIKNRFEIRLQDERAEQAVNDLMLYQDYERTTFGIINSYVRFVDKQKNVDRLEWKNSAEWDYFIGKGREKIKLTLQTQPYTLHKSLNWLSHQVMPTQKMLEEIDRLNGTTYISDIYNHAKLDKKHLMIIAQATTPIEEMIL